MGKTKIELNSSGIVELMKSQEIADVLEAEAKRMTLATGMEYQPDVYLNGRTRANAGGYQEDIDD